MKERYNKWEQHFYKDLEAIMVAYDLDAEELIVSTIHFCTKRSLNE